ncbi:MAG: hypothetical protein IJ186_00675 [Bacilli bacterium]|nr:hypothetical protein [Bacilli bacterium]
MKKISEIIKPFLSIIFGALLLLIYVNWLASDDSGTLVLGIFGVILSVFYLTDGIMDIIIGDKLPKKIFNIFTISLYPIFMFIMILIGMINLADYMGPTAWIISILSLIGTIAFILIFIINTFIENNSLRLLTTLFGGIFILVIIVNILFDQLGNVVTLGNLPIVSLLASLSYIGIVLDVLFGKGESNKEAKNEEPSINE